MNITKAAIFLEIDDKPHIVVLDDINIVKMCDVIAQMTKEKTLPVIKLSDDYKFKTLDEANKLNK